VRIDLLVLGIESRPGLVEEVRESQPDLRVLYLVDETAEEPAGSERSKSLLTPFSLSELRAAMTALLNRSGSAASAEAEKES
jgi:DNA-binding response OmpR family regulator